MARRAENLKKPPTKIATKTEGRDAKGRLLPGYCANPNPRAKGVFSMRAIIRKLLKEVDTKSNKTRAQVLFEKLMKDADTLQPKRRLDIMKFLTEHMDGKPQQSINVNSPQGVIEGLSNEELWEIANRAKSGDQESEGESDGSE